MQLGFGTGFWVPTGIEHTVFLRISNEFCEFVLGFTECEDVCRLNGNLTAADSKVIAGISVHKLIK